MAAATVVYHGKGEGSLFLPLGNKRLFRWSLVFGDGDTHDTGLNGIVEVALTGTRVQGSGTIAHASADCSVASISGSTVTLSAAGAGTIADLLVWADL